MAGISSRIYAISSVVTVRPRYFHSEAICRQCGKGGMKRKGFIDGFNTQRPPMSAALAHPGAGGKQQMRPMCSKRLRSFRARWPPSEAAFRQAFGASQNHWPSWARILIVVPPPAAKDEHAAGNGSALSFSRRSCARLRYPCLRHWARPRLGCGPAV